MMKIFTLMLFFCFFASINAQTSSLIGQLQGPESEAIVYANVMLLKSADSTLYKVAVSNDAGVFEMKGLNAGRYILKASYIGLNELQKTDIVLLDGKQLDLGIVSFTAKSLNLAEATVSATRPLVEVRPDRTVFNVTGTINSTGSDAISLLRKAPSVTVDNNDNISLLGRAGILLYVDGKRLPLTGQDQVSYLQTLTADQIDRIDIITNPGAKYEAEGNAGIIDIRLKKDKNLGANGTLGTTYAQGHLHRLSTNASGNYRNKKLNVFGSAGFDDGKRFDNMLFLSYLNGMVQDEINNNNVDFNNYNFRLGSDFFLSKKHTVGFLASGIINPSHRTSYNRITLAQQAQPSNIDSILIAYNDTDNDRSQQTYNLNYRFDDAKGRTFNVDLDYGNYLNKTKRYQPNRYYDASESILLTEVINSFDTPSEIDIYTLQLDFENNLWGGQLGIGSKISRVHSDNTFLVFNQKNEVFVQNDTLSNTFVYDEKVYAGYINYARDLNKKLNFSAGLRAEKTDATGDLKAFLPELQEPPVLQNYLSWFPTVGLMYKVSMQNSISFNAGRRINRPDYNVLNPFYNRISELSYERGNPFLKPEIVNNVDLGYTLAYRYNFKVGYSLTTNQIARLIAPDDIDPRAGFISWDNLATRKTWSASASIPAQVTKKWSAYFNASAAFINNQADYGNGATIDIQAFTYSIYQQHTFDLPWKLKGEISGYYAGPGVWGGVFRYNDSWNLNVGLQRKFFNDKLDVRISGSDLFYQSYWEGVSDFNGLRAEGSGRNDSRRASLSLNYRFGNQNVKSRKRSTSIEAEQDRVKG